MNGGRSRCPLERPDFQDWRSDDGESFVPADPGARGQRLPQLQISRYRDGGNKAITTVCKREVRVATLWLNQPGQQPTLASQRYWPTMVDGDWCGSFERQTH